MPTILACREATGCQHRVRYRYELASPVTQAIFDGFADTSLFQVSIYNPVMLLPQSKAVFQIQQRASQYCISGVIGLDYLIVAYMKGDEFNSVKSGMEETIRCLP